MNELLFEFGLGLFIDDCYIKLVRQGWFLEYSTQMNQPSMLPGSITTYTGHTPPEYWMQAIWIYKTEFYDKLQRYQMGAQQSQGLQSGIALQAQQNNLLYGQSMLGGVLSGLSSSLGGLSNPHPRMGTVIKNPFNGNE